MNAGTDALNAKDKLVISIIATIFFLLTYREFFNAFTPITRELITLVTLVVVSISLPVMNLSLGNKRSSAGHPSQIRWLPEFGAVIYGIYFVTAIILLNYQPQSVVARYFTLGIFPIFISIVSNFSYGAKIVLARWLLLLCMPIHFFAAQQFLFNEQSLGYSSFDSERAFIGQHFLGFSRVNGMVGNHVEYTLFVYLSSILAHIVYSRRPIRLLFFTGFFVVLSAFSGSRLGIVMSSVSLVLGVVMVSSTSRKSVSVLLGLCVVSLFLMVPFDEAIYQFLLNTFDTSLNKSAAASNILHLKEINDALTIWGQNPVLGNGLAHNLEQPSKIITDGLFFILLVEGGLVFVILWFGIFASIVAKLYQYWHLQVLIGILFLSYFVNSAMSLMANAVFAFVLFGLMLPSVITEKQ
jgi:hypothetical protein